MTEHTLKHICAGILAHVDAGKTTLSEGLLYLCGEIRKLGRVDHGDAFLDTYELEKERGITIFSKQAVLRTAGMEITLLDTPGHVDFSAEMERTLQVLDYAVLVISGMDGVQSHTITLWKLLERYQIPVFLFINKMDQEGTDRDGILSDLKKRLDENCIDFSADTDREEWMENVSLCDETLMESYLESGEIEQDAVAELIREKALHCLNEEIPHGIAVAIDRMKMERKVMHIDATIICERDSHKGIIIGKQGAMLKKIGSQARTEIEKMLEEKVNLKLWVKVKKDWRDSDFLIKNFGYDKKEV